MPAAIRERDRRITGRNRREVEPVLKRYDRVCFEKHALQPLDKPGLTRAVLMHPGHPLMLASAALHPGLSNTTPLGSETTPAAIGSR